MRVNVANMHAIVVDVGSALLVCIDDKQGRLGTKAAERDAQ